ncbi:hypothetical protein EU546_06340 [Candidatus Thorarchaeota archaeon]|nr:MAG: hypothetical protein EU546_06340 [Candidatus Thorarchaeota archaeon]
MYVEVRLPGGGPTVSGNLRFTDDGPTIHLDTGRVLKPDSQPITYFVGSKILPSVRGNPSESVLSEPLRVSLKPKAKVTRSYARKESRRTDTNYPPSTDGWLTRMVADAEPATFFLQELVGDEGFWLSIVDQSSNAILECHRIEPFEAPMVTLLEGWYVHRQLGEPLEPRRKFNPTEILKEKPLTWGEIHSLLADYEIDALERGYTLGESLDYLVPASFPPEVREEIAIFLAWVIRRPLPDCDPIDLYLQMPSITGAWLLGHYTNQLISDEDYPPYSKILYQAASGELGHTQLVKPHAHREEPWIAALYRCYDA